MTEVDEGLVLDDGIDGLLVLSGESVEPDLPNLWIRHTGGEWELVDGGPCAGVTDRAVSPALGVVALSGTQYGSNAPSKPIVSSENTSSLRSATINSRSG